VEQKNTFDLKVIGGILQLDYIVDPSIGPRNGTIFVNDTSVGTVNWTNPSWVNSSDGMNATASLGNGIMSRYLRVTGFGFNIPANSGITGINVTILKGADAALRVSDAGIRIVKNGNITGSYLNDSSAWPVTLTYDSYGNSTNLWGLSWTPADINNNTGFGVVCLCKIKSKHKTCKY